MNNDNLIWLYFLILLISWVAVIIILYLIDNRKKYYINSKFFLKDYEKKYVVILIEERGHDKYKIIETKSTLFYTLSPGDKISKKQFKELRGII